jgi:hypothetical protein
LRPWVAALSLALGIGANTAIFSLLNSLLLRTLPAKEPARLVTISSDAAIRMGFKAGLGWNYAMWDRFRQRAERSTAPSRGRRSASIWRPTARRSRSTASS